MQDLDMMAGTSPLKSTPQDDVFPVLGIALRPFPPPSV